MGLEEAKKIEMKKRTLVITNSSHAHFANVVDC